MPQKPARTCPRFLAPGSGEDSGDTPRAPHREVSGQMSRALVASGAFSDELISWPVFMISFVSMGGSCRIFCG